MTYLNQLMSGSDHAYQPRALADSMQQLAQRYELARRRFAFRFQRYPELSDYFFAQLYYRRLHPSIIAQIPSPDNLRLSGSLPFQAIVAAAINLQDTGRLVVRPMDVGPAGVGATNVVAAAVVPGSGGPHAQEQRFRPRKGTDGHAHHLAVMIEGNPGGCKGPEEMGRPHATIVEARNICCLLAPSGRAGWRRTRNVERSSAPSA